jgi:hypothetical protein
VAAIHRAAGPPTNTSYRSVALARSRWSLVFVKNFTIFDVISTDDFSDPPTEARGIWRTTSVDYALTVDTQ